METVAQPTHVLIRGHVFQYEEKAPFVKSGMSVLGALEYDPESDRIKCHECGEWFEHIGWKHLNFKHNITTIEYKHRHGINQTSGLCTPRFSKMRSKQHEPKQENTAKLIAAGRAHKLLYGNNLTNRGKQHERSNALGRCQAQALFRIQVLAAEKGRTPTSKELQESGLNQPLLVKRFGSVRRALELAGLETRPVGSDVASNRKENTLPGGFPTKEELWNARMPWPKEYFGLKWNSRSS